MSPFFWALWAVGVSLQVSLLHILVSRGLYRVKPILTSYCLVLFLTNVVDVSLLFNFGRWNDLGVTLYWADDAAREILLLVLVLAMIYRVTEGSPTRHASQLILALCTLGLAGGSVMWYWRANSTAWMTPVVRNLSFYAAILNVILWVNAIKARTDRLTLMLSAGIGLQMAGEAIGQSLRWLGFESHTMWLYPVGNTALIGAHILCLYIWLRALKAYEPQAPRAAHAMAD